MAQGNPISRLAALMEAFARDRIGQDVPWTAAPGPRAIVTEEDAVSAWLHVLLVVLEAFDTGEAPPERMEWAGAMLMVIRDHIRPLPSPLGSEATLRSDLRKVVELLREGRTII